MALEPRSCPTAGAGNDEATDPELRDMTRRFWLALRAHRCRCSRS
jgi:hypothetical protein